MLEFERKAAPKDVIDLGHVALELVTGCWSTAPDDRLWAVIVCPAEGSESPVVMELDGTINFQLLERLPRLDDLGAIHELFHRSIRLGRP